MILVHHRRGLRPRDAARPRPCPRMGAGGPCATPSLCRCNYQIRTGRQAGKHDHHGMRGILLPKPRSPKNSSAIGLVSIQVSVNIIPVPILCHFIVYFDFQTICFLTGIWVLGSKHRHTKCSLNPVPKFIKCSEVLVPKRRSELSSALFS